MARHFEGSNKLESDRFAALFADGHVWDLSATVPFSTLRKFLTIEGAKRADRDIALRKYKLN